MPFSKPDGLLGLLISVIAALLGFGDTIARLGSLPAHLLFSLFILLFAASALHGPRPPAAPPKP